MCHCFGILWFITCPFCNSDSLLSSDKLLIIGGRLYDFSEQKSSEVLDVFTEDGPTANCPNFIDFPEALESPNGAYFPAMQRVVVCGGGIPVENSCYMYKHDFACKFRFNYIIFKLYFLHHVN